jgi:hypothetical protein
VIDLWYHRAPNGGLRSSSGGGPCRQSGSRAVGQLGSGRPVRRVAGDCLVELAHESTLQTIAEISAAFVGFSLVGGLLGTESSDRYRFYSIRDVAEVGLSCLLGALIPSAIHAFGFRPEVSWRLASGLFSVVWIAAAYIGISRFWRAGVQRHAPRYLWLGPFSGIAGNALLLWSVLLPSAASPARYVLALILLLSFAGVSFIAAVFHGRTAPPAT